MNRSKKFLEKVKSCAPNQGNSSQKGIRVPVHSRKSIIKESENFSKKYKKGDKVDVLYHNEKGSYPALIKRIFEDGGWIAEIKPLEKGRSNYAYIDDSNEFIEVAPEFIKYIENN